MKNEISKFQDIIDSRDIIEEIDGLKDDHELYKEQVSDCYEDLQNADPEIDDITGLKEQYIKAQEDLEEWELNNDEYLNVLEKLADEGEDLISDWIYGEALIHEDYFIEYVKDMLENTGPGHIPSYIEIDWEATVENIKADYTELDFDGETYLARS